MAPAFVMLLKQMILYSAYRINSEHLFTYFFIWLVVLVEDSCEFSSQKGDPLSSALRFYWTVWSVIYCLFVCLFFTLAA